MIPVYISVLPRVSWTAQALGLSSTQLTDVAAIALSRALERGQQQHANDSEPEEIIAICRLRRLDLSRNSIADEGAR